MAGRTPSPTSPVSGKISMSISSSSSIAGTQLSSSPSASSLADSHISQQNDTTTNSDGSGEQHMSLLPTMTTTLQQLPPTTTTTAFVVPPVVVRVGGPHTSLPFFVESCACWILAVGCLTVACWHYVRQLSVPYWRQMLHGDDAEYDDEDGNSNSNSSNSHAALLRELPLMTHSRRELASVSTLMGLLDRYGQLVEWLEFFRPLEEWTSDTTPAYRAELVGLIRKHGTARRLVSLIMRRRDLLPKSMMPTKAKAVSASASASSVSSASETTSSNGNSSSSSAGVGKGRQGARRPTSLAQVLLEIWPQLMELPTTEQPQQQNEVDDDDNNDNVMISVILPAHGENGTDLAYKLRQAVTCACQPHRLEILIVNAGQCTEMDVVEEAIQMLTTTTTTTTTRGLLDKDDGGAPPPGGESNGGKISNGGGTSGGGSCSIDRVQQQHRPVPGTGPHISILDYPGGGGRGPCLNFGASRATGRILTFLHADTRLGPDWDVAVRGALFPQNGGAAAVAAAADAAPTTTSSPPCKTSRFVNSACAFSFAIDASSQATQQQGGSSGDLPPGIRAVETTANWRTRLFHLPYGDQCLSLPKSVFDHVGGYPDQCLMEDYELVRLLRQRVAAIPHERLAILPQRAYCSPRRWQRFGVLYVTYTNSQCVNMYSRGDMTPDELFCRYYGTASGPAREREVSPWELQLQQELEEGVDD